MRAYYHFSCHWSYVQFYIFIRPSINLQIFDPSHSSLSFSCLLLSFKACSKILECLIFTFNVYQLSSLSCNKNKTKIICSKTASQSCNQKSKYQKISRSIEKKHQFKIIQHIWLSNPKSCIMHLPKILKK